MAVEQVVGDAWTPDLAERTARELGMALRPSHWHVVGCARELWAARGIAPDLALLARTTGLSTEAIRSLFPDAEHTIAWIAGVG